MATETHVHQRADYPRLIALLQPLLPNSLPIYRSLQLPRHPPNTFVVSTIPVNIESLTGHDFVILFYECRGGSLSSGTVFSSLQLQESGSDGKIEEQILDVFSKLRAIKPATESDLLFMVMTHSKIGEFLRERKVTREDQLNLPMAGKYVYRQKILRPQANLGEGKGALAKFMPYMNKSLPEGLEYDFIREKDVPRVLETNATVKFREGLVGLPNVFIRETKSGKAVCWLFATRQGSMGISNCEPEYRRKKLASHTGDFLSQVAFVNFGKPFPYALKDQPDHAGSNAPGDLTEYDAYAKGTTKKDIAEEWMHQDAFVENLAATTFMKNLPITWIQNSYWLLVDLGKVDETISQRARQRNRL